jgi:hypothetical protein
MKGYPLDLIWAIQSKADGLGRVFFLRTARPEQRPEWRMVGDRESSRLGYGALNSKVTAPT